MLQKLLLLSPLLSATGNTSTVNRLKDHFYRNGTNILLMCPSTVRDSKYKHICNVKVMNAIIKDEKIEGILIVHALKSGICFVCSCGQNCKVTVKYGVIFGGTDINEDIHNEMKYKVIEACIKNSSFLVAFSNFMSEIACRYFPQSTVFVQPQAVDYHVYDWCTCYKALTATSTLREENAPIFVLPCSIRPVKDPLFIVQAFIDERQKLTDGAHPARLLIVGPVTDDKYGAEFFNKLGAHTKDHRKLEQHLFVKQPFAIPEIKQMSSSNDDVSAWLHDPRGSIIQYIPALPHEVYLNCLRSGTFFAVLNTSTSEGMSSAILEAMSCGVLVMARNIPGNRSIISEQENGLLFSTPEEFVNKAETALQMQLQRRQIVLNAKTTILEKHSPHKEANFYVSLIQNHF